MSALRKAEVMFKDALAGVLEETSKGYRFTYDTAFLRGVTPLGVAFPLREQPYECTTLFPFFKGLLSEGWLRAVICQTLKLDPKDEFGLLIKTCGDCIGAVWIKA